MLEPLLGQRVLVVGGQGTTVPGSLEELRTANTGGMRIPIGDRALAFALDNKRMAEEGLKLYAENANAAFEHVNLGYNNPRDIQPDLPNIRSLHGGDNPRTGAGLPLAGTGIATPYPDGSGRLGVEETQDVFGARFLYNRGSQLTALLDAGRIAPSIFNKELGTAATIARALQDRAQLLYDSPKRIVDKVIKAYSALGSRGIAHEAGLITPAGFSLESGLIPFSAGDFVAPGAGPARGRQAKTGGLSAKEAYDAQVRADRIREIRERQGR